MSEQDGTQVATIQRPHTTNPKAWKAYWEGQGQAWRTEPEIDNDRRMYLEGLLDEELLTLEAQKENEGINTHPFEDVQMSRADIEWLLATHKDGNWSLFLNEAVYIRLGEGNRGTLFEHKGLNLSRADVRTADLKRLPLENVDFTEAHLEGAIFSGAYLEDAIFSGAHLQYSYFFGTHLENADFCNAHLEGACLAEARLQGSNLSYTLYSEATNLRGACLSDGTYGAASLVGVHWGDVDLSAIDWIHVDSLGEEQRAIRLKNHKENDHNIWKKTKVLIDAYRTAVRANRQLSVVLRNQGLNEEAARFAYRAQLMQRKVFWNQGFRSFGQYLFSLFLDLLTGYGYKPVRSFLAYLLVITMFATAYFVIGHTEGPVLSPLGSFVFSMTSFHGRGFFPGGITLDDPLTVLAALEAFVGLLIEVTFIATLTQRLFGK